VDEALLEDVGVALDDLRHEDQTVLLRQSLLDLATEVGVAQLGDDVGVVLGGVDLVQGEDVGHVLHRLEYLYFGREQRFINLVLEHLQVDHLHRHRLVRGVVAAAVDLAGVALPNGVAEPVGVVLDFLAGVGLVLGQVLL
jgi:hypothetical protein